MWHSTTTLAPPASPSEPAGHDYDTGGSGPDEELQPTIVPYACLPSYYTDRLETNRAPAAALSEPIPLPRVLANVQYLFENGIILWPNFTVLADAGGNVTTAGSAEDVDYCLPNCGLCTTHTGDVSYFFFNLLVIGALLPLVGLCGVVGNSLSAYVYSRPSMRGQSTNLYLCALGCSDNAVILTALFLFFVDSIKRHSATLSVVYGRLSPVIYPAGMIAQTCSVYFTLVAGVDCFVQVCMNRELRRCFASVRFARGAITATLIFSVLYNVPHGFEAILVDCWHVQFRSRSVEVCPAPFRFNQTYTTIYYKYMYSIFLAVGPLLVLIVLNSCIIFVTVCTKRRSRRKAAGGGPAPAGAPGTLARVGSTPTNRTRPVNGATTPIHKTPTEIQQQTDKQQQRQKQQQYSPIYHNHHHNDSIRTGNYSMRAGFVAAKPILKSAASLDGGGGTARSVSFDNEPNPAGSASDDNMALILVVLLFIACNTIALLINVFEQRLSALLEWRINYIIDVSNLLVVFNSSFNIVIYYNFSRAYRATFLREVCRWRRGAGIRRPGAPDGAGTRVADSLANENSRTELLGSTDAEESFTGLAAAKDSPIPALGGPSTKLDYCNGSTVPVLRRKCSAGSQNCRRLLPEFRTPPLYRPGPGTHPSSEILEISGGTPLSEALGLPTGAGAVVLRLCEDPASGRTQTPRSCQSVILVQDYDESDGFADACAELSPTQDPARDSRRAAGPSNGAPPAVSDRLAAQKRLCINLFS